MKNIKQNQKNNKQQFLKIKAGLKQNTSFKNLNSRRMQIFSGKRGK